MIDNKQPYWQPTEEKIKNTNMYKLMTKVNGKYNLNLSSYSELHHWSIDNKKEFWAELWELAEVRYSENYNDVYTDDLHRKKIPRPIWFPGAKINFAENLLKYRDDSIALISHRENRNNIRLSYNDLYSQVAKIAQSMRDLGVVKGDRVAGFVTNIPETIVCMLAATSIGAIWSSSSPDFGFQGIMDRFGQIKPKILIAVNGYSYNGKHYDSTEKLEKIVANISSIEKIIVLEEIDVPLLKGEKYILYSELMKNSAEEIIFEQTIFDHPVYIMYSSGTTGIPKCIVHGAGGTFLQHFKEHYLHGNLNKGDVLSYFTTCGWMMWNWLVGGLSVGATLYLFDGSPTYPDTNIMWNEAAKEKIKALGTSPKFLTHCQKEGVHPGRDNDLSALETIYSTGSPLVSENYQWVYSEVKPNVQLASISGGTDIVSCFMLGNPMLGVFDEEIQSIGLGMDVRALSDEGKEVIGKKGELICHPPFPCMPTHFWDDPNDEKYFEAYFDYYEWIWRHGDYIEITQRGGVIVYGRSDATLNPGGIRIGTAEIYRIVEAMPEITSSIVVGQQYESDTRVVLFIVLKNGIELTEELISKIKSNIRKGATPRHVPAIVRQVQDVPVTLSGKKVELAVTKIVNGEEVKNRSALANPDCLDEYLGLV
ncbi:MAG: acetoacetate--CoA ligase [Ignavibacteriae bacterium]|nr:acetoacetate--CoA ligase [Ignavibacteriota bacterium]MCB9221733.1 acetoacetate--CoA ligase [Ignavibacteria bacterium]